MAWSSRSRQDLFAGDVAVIQPASHNGDTDWKPITVFLFPNPDSTSRCRDVKTLVPQSPASALIAFGSNQGDRHQMLHLAVEQLNAQDSFDVLAVSDAIETKPVGEQSQDAYLNAVIHAATSLTATQLVSQLLDIERQLGRKRIRRWGPRSVDLDLLLLGDEIIDQPETTVPHPRMSFRRFVLEPASQIAPQLVHPDQWPDDRRTIALLKPAREQSRGCGPR